MELSLVSVKLISTLCKDWVVSPILFIIWLVVLKVLGIESIFLKSSLTCIFCVDWISWNYYESSLSSYFWFPITIWVYWLIKCKYLKWNKVWESIGLLHLVVCDAKRGWREGEIEEPHSPWVNTLPISILGCDILFRHRNLMEHTSRGRESSPLVRHKILILQGPHRRFPHNPGVILMDKKVDFSSHSTS